MAPRLIRSPVTPNTCMPNSAIDIDAEMPSTTTSAPRSVPRKQREHDGDDERALDEVREHGRQRATDEVRAVVDGLDDDARRQLALDLLRLRSFTAWTTSRLLAPMSIIVDAGDGLALAVARDDAVPQRGADLHLRDVPHEQRRAVGGGAEHDVGDLLLVLRAGRRRRSVNDSRAAIEVAAADADVGALERRGDVLQRHLVGVEPAAIDDDLVLLEVAAHRVHLDDAGHAAQLRDDLPVEDRAQLRRRVVVGAHDELVDLAEAARHRRELAACRRPSAGSPRRRARARAPSAARTRCRCRPRR